MWITHLVDSRPVVPNERKMGYSHLNVEFSTQATLPHMQQAIRRRRQGRIHAVLFPKVQVRGSSSMDE
jgi:hypothetical protein